MKYIIFMPSFQMSKKSLIHSDFMVESDSEEIVVR